MLRKWTLTVFQVGYIKLFNLPKVTNLPDPVKRKILAERENMPGTGVKGVLADYKTHMKLQNAQKVAEEEQRKQLLHRMVTGVSRPTDASESRTMTAADHAMVSLQIAINKKVNPATIYILAFSRYPFFLRPYSTLIYTQGREWERYPRARIGRC